MALTNYIYSIHIKDSYILVDHIVDIYYTTLWQESKLVSLKDTLYRIKNHNLNYFNWETIYLVKDKNTWNLKRYIKEFGNTWI